MRSRSRKCAIKVYWCKGHESVNGEAFPSAYRGCSATVETSVGTRIHDASRGQPRQVVDRSHLARRSCPRRSRPKTRYYCPFRLTYSKVLYCNAQARTSLYVDPIANRPCAAVSLCGKYFRNRTVKRTYTQYPRRGVPMPAHEIHPLSRENGAFFREKQRLSVVRSTFPVRKSRLPMQSCTVQAAQQRETCVPIRDESAKA
ncbi:hypothetical protein L227DRAFT_151876 [Lentinus tigrinus ALCF2SS1-6]|uniref:Uncharacterized protein n=1 Tax=Lentinus tigrinus ALCF2SS1-6 TaxID=1328759 RepID=A0A5C2S6S2_9APHY|nr:hypothetical protein L227DRAFT_151876 [Lentinus tigrinus ALCF2SS1-6]